MTERTIETRVVNHGGTKSFISFYRNGERIYHDEALIEFEKLADKDGLLLSQHSFKLSDEAKEEFKNSVFLFAGSNAN